MWEFDKTVASRFEQEAHNHIPDYQRVIELCCSIAERKGLPLDATIVDIGSALGETLYQFKGNGYDNVYGVESSESMKDASMYRDRIILSSVYPPNLKADMVTMNWTLHFIKDKYSYLQAIYDNLSNAGMLILTDKTIQSELTKELYYDFKRNNGVSDEYIVEKENQLKGYMHLENVDWYFYTLDIIGFKPVEIINSALGFTTFYCEK